MPSTDARSLFSPGWSGSAVAHTTTDEAFLQAMLDVEAALAETQASLGVIPSLHAAAVRACAVVSRFCSVDLADRALDGGNPVIPLVADLRLLVDDVEVGAGASVHLGATSQDIIDSALMLMAQRASAIILGDLQRAADAVASLAAAHRATVMAGRTLTQHATPITFGLKAARWLDGLTEAAADLRRERSRLPVQLGGASGTLAASAARSGPDVALAVVDGLASRLDLVAPALTWHTQRLPVTRLGDAIGGCASVLGTIGADVSFLSRTEIGEVSEALVAGKGGSSAMPQKRNPVASVLVTAACAPVSGLSAEVHRAAVSADERPPGAWHTEWATLRDLLRAVGGAAALAATLLEGLTVDVDRMAANLDLTQGLVLAERLSVELGPVIGAAGVCDIVRAAGDGGGLSELLLALRHEQFPDGRLDDAVVQRLLDPAGYLGATQQFIDRALTAHASAPRRRETPSPR